MVYLRKISFGPSFDPQVSEEGVRTYGPTME